jgi:hypothetical protein
MTYPETTENFENTRYLDLVRLSLEFNRSLKSSLPSLFVFFDHAA